MTLTVQTQLFAFLLLLHGHCGIAQRVWLGFTNPGGFVVLREPGLFGTVAGGRAYVTLRERGREKGNS